MLLEGATFPPPSLPALNSTATSPPSPSEGMRRIIALAILLLFVNLCQVVEGANFTDCYLKLRHRNVTEGTVDTWGHSVTNINDAVGYTYQNCLKYCGTGTEAFNWPQFNQQFTAWLLPWLALISQLPYGANDPVRNFEAMILTVGSPMHAAYSLALAVTSNRFMVKRFRQSNHPRTLMAAKALSHLQQVSFTLPKEEDVIPSLVVLQENDEWWRLMDEGLNYAGPRWTLAAIMSIIYVALAYVFAWVSTLESNITGQMFASGQSVGSLWLSLLPIVTCYLQMSPKCEVGRIRKVIEDANKSLHVATESDGPKLIQGSRAITVHVATSDVVYGDQICSTPICFYARVQIWLEAVCQVTDAFQAASESAFLGATTPRTRSGVMDWCALHETQGISRGYEFFSIHLRSVILAAFLQWGTTLAAMMALILTPTRGFGCRSASFLFYGSISTLVWLFLLISNILTRRYTAARECKRPATIIAVFVLLFRQLAKFLAAVNTTWIIVSTLFQFSNVYDNCYCNSSVFGLGKHAYAVLHFTDATLSLTKLYWAAGMVFSSGTALIFIFAINLLMKKPDYRLS